MKDYVAGVLVGAILVSVGWLTTAAAPGIAHHFEPRYDYGALDYRVVQGFRNCLGAGEIKDCPRILELGRTQKYVGDICTWHGEWKARP